MILEKNSLSLYAGLNITMDKLCVTQRKLLKKVVASAFFLLDLLREKIASRAVIDVCCDCIKNICIVEMQGIGDALAVLPAATSLKQKFPKAGLTLISQKVTAELFQGLSLFQEIIPLGFNKSKLGVADFILSIPRLRENEYDLFIVPSWSLRHTAVSLLIRSKARVGYLHDHSRQMLYHNDYGVETRGMRSLHDVVYFKEEHIITRALKTLEPLGIQQAGVSQYHLEVSQADASFVLRFLKERYKLDADQKYIVMATGAVWKGRCWSPEKWKIFVEMLGQGNDLKFLLIGSREEEQKNNFVCDNVRTFNLCGHLSLSQLPALIARSHAFIGVDSGPMHLAASLGKPVIALFGPNIPGVSGPRGSLCAVVQKEMECRPCNQDFCPQPKGQTCMDLINPSDVMAAYKHLKQRMSNA